MKRSTPRYLLCLAAAASLTLGTAAAEAHTGANVGDLFAPKLPSLPHQGFPGLLAEQETHNQQDASPSVDPSEANLPAQELTGEMLYRFLLAEIAGSRGDIKVSLAAYLELAELTRDPRVAKRAVQIAFAANDSNALLNATQFWAEIDPQSKEARELLANLLDGATDGITRAQKVLENVLAHDEKKRPANLLGLTRVMGSAKNPKLTRGFIYTLTDPYLAYPESHFVRAQANLAAEDPDRAMRSTNRALKLRPDWPAGVLFKAQLLIERQALPEAREIIDAALRVHPKVRELRLAQVQAMVIAREFAAARGKLMPLLGETPHDASLLYTAGSLAQEMGEPAEAEALFRRALQARHPDSDNIRIQIGKITAARGDHTLARRWYGVVTDPALKDEVTILTARSLAREGRLKEARALLRNAPDDDTRQRFFFVESQLLADAGRAGEALDIVDKAIAKDPANNDLLYESAMLAERIGKFNIMEERLRKVIAADPENAHAYNALGYSYAERGVRLDEAEKLIARAIELLPKNPYILDSLGWVRFKRGDLASALALLEEAYSLRSEPEIAAHLGEVLWQLKRNDEAHLILNNALNAHPDNAYLQKIIKRLYPEATPALKQQQSLKSRKP